MKFNLLTSICNIIFVIDFINKQQIINIQWNFLLPTGKTNLITLSHNI